MDLFKYYPFSYTVVRTKIYIAPLLPIFSVLSPSFPEECNYVSSVGVSQPGGCETPNPN